jgi:hypothetical protein
MAVVHRPGDDEIAAAARQKTGRLLDGEEGGGAGRVEGVGGAFEVEAVRGPRGGETGDESDGCLRPFGAEAGLEGLAYRRDPVLAQLGGEFAQGRRELVGGTYTLVEAGGGDAHEPASAEDDADPGPVGGEPPLSPGIGHGLGDDAQREQLIGLGSGHRGGHDAVVRRVEGGEIVDEAATPAVEAVAAGRSFGAVRIVVDLGVPAVGRYVGDGVRSGEEVVPVCGEVGGSGKDGAHADDGGVGRTRAAARVSHGEGPRGPPPGLPP